MRSISVLKIECLQNYWGYILDMPLTVGEVFDDISGNTDISRSIVRVVRSPPTPDELENPLRSISLAPESSARPQKRSLTRLPGVFLDDQHRGENAQRWGSDSLIDDDVRASKRRKLQNLISHTVLGSDRPIFSSESLQERVYTSSRTSARRLSPNRQIIDSPRSSLRKRMYVASGRLYKADDKAEDNSYGTPMSLSLNSPSRADSSKSYDLVAIPDSPLRRDASPANRNILRATNFEPHAPRSESPELGSTNNRGVLHGSGVTSTQEARLGTRVLQGHVESPLVTPEPVKNESDRLGDQPTLREPSYTISRLRDIVDPVNREGEKSHELPNQSHKNYAESGIIATTMDNLEDRDRGKGDEIAIANMTKNRAMVQDNGVKQYRASVDQNKKAALQRTSRSDSKAADGTPKGTSDEIMVEAKSKGAHSAEGGARQSQVEDEKFNEMRPVVEADKVGLVEEKLARNIAPTERAMIPKRADEISEKKKLPDKGAGNAKLVEEGGTVRPTEGRATRAALAKGKAAEAASVDTNADTKMAEDRGEATENLNADPQAGSLSMHKTRLANLAKGKKAVKAAKKRRVQDRSDKKDAERREECEEKPLRESEESVSISQMKSPKDENPTAASHSVPVHNAEDISEHNAKNKKLENTRMQSDIINESARNSGAQKTPKKMIFSDARRQSSTTPLSTQTEPDRLRKSMTPPYPSSLISKSRPKSSAPSPGTPLRKTLNSDTLPRSAVKQTSSIGRRSVSFAEDSAIVSGAQYGIALSDSKNSNRGINPVRKIIKIENATEALAEFQAPKKKPEESKAPTTKDAKKEKTRPKLKIQTEKNANQKKMQSKLKIQKDVKLEGRAIDPPIPPKTATQEEIIISSASDSSVSSFYSEDDREARNAKPGPSERRRLIARVAPSKETAQKLTRIEDAKPSTGAPKTDRPKESSPSTSVVISTKETSNPRTKVQKPNKESSSTPVQIIDPQILSFASSERSSPRAPAQYMSKADSISSRTTSNASGSESDENNSPPVETKRQPVEEDTRPGRITPDISADVKMLHANPISLNGSQSSSRSSQAPSVGSRSSGSTRSSRSKHIERAAEQQLQRESRESMGPSKPVRPASRNSKSAANKNAATSPVPGLTPSNSDFPRMTDLMKKRSAFDTSGSGNQRSSYPLPSRPDASKKATLSPFSVSDSSSSSSDDDEDT